MSEVYVPGAGVAATVAPASAVSNEVEVAPCPPCPPSPPCPTAAEDEDDVTRTATPVKARTQACIVSLNHTRVTRPIHNFNHCHTVVNKIK